MQNVSTLAYFNKVICRLLYIVLYRFFARFSVSRYDRFLNKSCTYGRAMSANFLAFSALLVCFHQKQTFRPDTPALSKFTLNGGQFTRTAI